MADEPLFMAIRDSDPEFQQTIRDAQDSLAEFRLRSDHAGGYPCVKTRITAGEETAFIWLLVVKATRPGFVASVFEIPPEFKGIKVDDEVRVPNGEVMDWMLNQDGVLRGGFSLRYQRSRLPADKRAGFDKHIGVTEYA
jgi:uncharacterized protein YegJ (DUF2314 family)